jgi:hypothetical protein
VPTPILSTFTPNVSSGFSRAVVSCTSCPKKSKASTIRNSIFTLTNCRRVLWVRLLCTLICQFTVLAIDGMCIGSDRKLLATTEEGFWHNLLFSLSNSSTSEQFCSSNVQRTTTGFFCFFGRLWSSSSSSYSSSMLFIWIFRRNEIRNQYIFELHYFGRVETRSAG